MQPNPNSLSEEDVKRLIENPSTEARVNVIEKMSKQYADMGFNEEQLRTAEEIFNLVVQEAETEVKKVLAENIVSTSIVPKDIILSLARDIDEIACPVLEFSNAFTEAELIELVKGTESIAQQVSIANREQVPEKVSEALIEKDNEEVVDNLLQNVGAGISEDTYSKVVENYSGNEKMVESLLSRGTLSENIVKKITSTVSDSIKKNMEKKYNTQFNNIHKFFEDTGESAAIGAVTKQNIDKTLIELIDKLEMQGALEDALLEHSDPSLEKCLNNSVKKDNALILITALTLGRLTLFNAIASRFGNLKYSNVATLTSDKNGFQALYEKLSLPQKMFDVTRTAAKVLVDLERKAAETKTSRPFENLYLYMKNLANEGREIRIPNLSLFISMVRKHTNSEKDAKGDW